MIVRLTIDVVAADLVQLKFPFKEAALLRQSAMNRDGERMVSILRADLRRPSYELKGRVELRANEFT